MKWMINFGVDYNFSKWGWRRQVFLSDKSKSGTRPFAVFHFTILGLWMVGIIKKNVPQTSSFSHVIRHLRNWKYLGWMYVGWPVRVIYEYRNQHMEYFVCEIIDVNWNLNRSRKDRILDGMARILGIELKTVWKRTARVVSVV